MDIIIYTTTTCPYCNMLKVYLKEKGIAFSEKVVDKDPAAQEEMMKVSGGFVGVPFTVVQKNGETVKIQGFDKARVDQTLGIS